MAFDYYDRITKDMGTAAINAATAAATQLTALYTGSTNAEAMPPVLTIGVTLMPGIDDYPKKTEITYVKDAKAVLAFARVNSITTLSIWAIQRDNSGCPGTGGSSRCPGIVQSTWEFSQILQAFTS